MDQMIVPEAGSPGGVRQSTTEDKPALRRAIERSAP